jgi:uncharacterized membrane protein
MSPKPATKRFWLWWLLVTLSGTILGALIAFVALTPLLSRSTQLVYGLVIGAVFGTVVGTSQWLVLRRYLPAVGW